LALLVINLLTTPQWLWFIIPMCGWGVGLLMHGFSTFVVRGSDLKERLTRKELQRLRDAQDADYSTR